MASEQIQMHVSGMNLSNTAIKCHHHLTERKMAKSRVQLMYIISQISNSCMTHRLITSFLTYLDNIINILSSHYRLLTLSHIIFDYLFARSYLLIFVCEYTQTQTHS